MREFAKYEVADKCELVPLEEDLEDKTSRLINLALTGNEIRLNNGKVLKKLLFKIGIFIYSFDYTESLVITKHRFLS